ncbi:MAG: hypothetical protein ERJ67_04140 [Aphanocapsa feldmannii 277cV]|uniref:Uncharacterized protein n=2 Tax=Aphanocapsa feldmannii TaxID=192050 RepID=A0A524RP60_9CHRO|nr:MAG: hypothetical protein ERJ69_01715 [Aphanocapsa feldmannii 288cV]TGG93135.1 MAG: hypothetical protein ERJ67_04140 [Aphanocapsa feldmannii 277cV]TGH21569.1 MAG: hypothetical protein ERJ68_05435 [Aphanocapsa feldmannii 277cI]
MGKLQLTAAIWSLSLLGSWLIRRLGRSDLVLPDQPAFLLALVFGLPMALVLAIVLRRPTPSQNSSSSNVEE